MRERTLPNPDQSNSPRTFVASVGYALASFKHSDESIYS
jgi:hypothetical protein